MKLPEYRRFSAALMGKATFWIHNQHDLNEIE